MNEKLLLEHHQAMIHDPINWRRSVCCFAQSHENFYSYIFICIHILRLCDKTQSISVHGPSSHAFDIVERFGGVRAIV